MTADPIVLHVRWANGKGTRSPEAITAIEPPATSADGTTTALLSYEYAVLSSKLGLVAVPRLRRRPSPAP
jgi:hypothetical protein